MNIAESHFATAAAYQDEALRVMEAAAGENRQMSASEIDRFVQLMRDATGATEAAIAESKSASRPDHGDGPRASAPPELKEFLEPGHPRKQFWIGPGVASWRGAPSDYLQKASPYVTGDTSVTGSGYFFTPDLYRDVVTGLIDGSGVLEAQPTLILTDHLRPIQVPVLTADAVASAGTEGLDATQTNTEGDAVTLGAHRYDGRFIVSAEQAMSAEYSMEQLLSTFASRAITTKIAEVLALGAGTTEPLGLFRGAGVGKTTAVAGAVTPEELIDLTKSLGKGYRKAARLIASDALHTAMLKWREDDSDGTGAFLLRSTEGGGYQFAGKPVFTEPQADQSGLSAGEVHAVYGDTSGYFVRMTPMLFAKDDSNPLVVVFRFALWLDACVADAGAVRALKLASGA